jgi:hypothetical protein
MQVVGLDPGVTTGYAKYDLTTGFWSQIHLGPMDHHMWLYNMLYDDDPDVVVCERFNYQRRDKVILTSVEYIGVAKYYCATRETPYVAQNAGDAKRLWPEEKIKALGLWIASMPHAMDATRHVLYYVTIGMKDYRFVNALRPAG